MCLSSYNKSLFTPEVECMNEIFYIKINNPQIYTYIQNKYAKIFLNNE